MILLAVGLNSTDYHLASQGNFVFSIFCIIKSNIPKIILHHLSKPKLKIIYSQEAPLMKQLAPQSDNNSQSQVKTPKTPKIVTPVSKKVNQYAGKLTTQQIPRLIMPHFTTLEDKADKFYQQYQRLFLDNQHLNYQLAQVIQNRNQLAEKFNAIKRTKVTEEAVKRKRRYARDIERQFYCPIEKCHRGYGSEGSLSHHVRLKHFEFYQSGKYEIFIQKYIDQLQNKKGKQEEAPHEETPQKPEKKIKKQEIKKEVVAMQQPNARPRRSKKDGKQVKQQGNA